MGPEGAPAAPKIDLHTHILPRDWPDLKQRYGYGGFVRLEHGQEGCARMMQDDTFFREVDGRLWEPRRRLEDCRHDGVDIQVLSTVPVMFSYWARAQHADDLSRLLNDHIASVVEAHPGRFLGLGTVPLQDPGLAVKELERCVHELGFPGVQIGSHVNDWNLDQPELFPFFQAAQELDAAVFVHPWDMLGKDRTGSYMLAWLVGMPAETSLAICSLIFGGVLERLPRLRIAFAHGGGAYPATLGRIDRGFHGRPDLCAQVNGRPPRDYAGRFYLDTLVHDPEVLRLLLRQVGAGRLMLGSDYPFPLGEEKPGALIESMDDLTAVDRRSLLGGTAQEFLGRGGAPRES